MRKIQYLCIVELKPTIIMDEKRIRQIITETVEEYIHKQFVCEYAHPRKEFCKYVSNLLPQIITHWCLIRYGNLTNQTININHWKRELSTWCNYIVRLSLKDETYQKRYKAIESVFDLWDYDKNPTAIIKTITHKFIEENFNTDSKEFEQTITDCFNENKTLIEVLANVKPMVSIEYINNL